VRKIWIVAALLSLMASAVEADGWSRYVNTRFNYALDIPPGFSDVAESDNGDGGVSMSNDRRTRLSVWGNHITDGTFADEIARRVAQDKAEGWQISYDRRLPKAASWSGSRGDQILYQRSVAGCDDVAVYFRLEYDRSVLKANDPIVSRLVKSLQGQCQETSPPPASPP
jgi:hypothetical protein